MKTINSFQNGIPKPASYVINSPTLPTKLFLKHVAAVLKSAFKTVVAPQSKKMAKLSVEFILYLLFF